MNSAITDLKNGGDNVKSTMRAIAFTVSLAATPVMADPAFTKADYKGQVCSPGPKSAICNCIDNCTVETDQCLRSWSNSTPLINAFNTAVRCAQQSNSCTMQCNWESHFGK
jgi:hypothetical protein